MQNPNEICAKQDLSEAIDVLDRPVANQFGWTTKGFNAFSVGTLGNGGQNLYVSRKGILQRIHHFDMDRDG